MTEPKRCKDCKRSRKDLKDAKDIPIKYRKSLWVSANGDQHCWACNGNAGRKLMGMFLTYRLR